MTTDDRAALAARHQPQDIPAGWPGASRTPRCRACNQPWEPDGCDTARALALLDECEREFLRQRDCDHSECIEHEEAAVAEARALPPDVATLRALLADHRHPGSVEGALIVRRDHIAGWVESFDCAAAVVDEWPKP